jgi:hypothetical protein
MYSTWAHMSAETDFLFVKSPTWLLENNLKKGQPAFITLTGAQRDWPLWNDDGGYEVPSCSASIRSLNLREDLSALINQVNLCSKIEKLPDIDSSWRKLAPEQLPPSDLIRAVSHLLSDIIVIFADSLDGAETQLRKWMESSARFLAMNFFLSKRYTAPYILIVVNNTQDSTSTKRVIDSLHEASQDDLIASIELLRREEDVESRIIDLLRMAMRERQKKLHLWSVPEYLILIEDAINTLSNQRKYEFSYVLALNSPNRIFSAETHIWPTFLERAKASIHLDFGLTVLAQCLSRYALNCQHGKYDLVL